MTVNEVLMDWRNREYYLVNLKFNHNEQIQNLKLNIKSLKVKPPFNHFREEPTSENTKKCPYHWWMWAYDGTHCQLLGIDDIRPTDMISVRKEDEEAFLELLQTTKLSYLHGFPIHKYSKIIKLTKEACKQ